MATRIPQWAMVAAVASLASLPAIGVQAAPPPDANLYTSYQFSSDGTSINWLTCGATQQTSGCYGSGRLTGFGKVCAALEGTELVSGNVVTRHLYILDRNYMGSGVLVLDVFLKKDVVTPTFDAATIVQTGHVALPVQSSASATCYAAASDRFLYAGTSSSTNAAQIAKVGLKVTSVGGFDPPIPVSSITADSRGYVTVNFGSGSNTGFVIFTPEGAFDGDGGGNAILFNDRSAFTLP